MSCIDKPRRHGPTELQAIKDASCLSDDAIGGLLGVSGPTVLHWRREVKTPEYAYRVALQILTTELDERGQVSRPGIPLDAWDRHGREAKIIARAKPLAQLLAAMG